MHISQSACEANRKYQALFLKLKTGKAKQQRAEQKLKNTAPPQKSLLSENAKRLCLQAAGVIDLGRFSGSQSKSLAVLCMIDAVVDVGRRFYGKYFSAVTWQKQN